MMALEEKFEITLDEEGEWCDEEEGLLSARLPASHAFRRSASGGPSSTCTCTRAASTHSCSPPPLPHTNTRRR
jgi:hypothetical protein